MITGDVTNFTPGEAIQKAYERACNEGRFFVDSRTPFKSGIEEEDYQIHEVLFRAYDGYHYGSCYSTREEADKVCAEVNALHSVELVDAYWEKLREKQKNEH